MPLFSATETTRRTGLFTRERTLVVEAHVDGTNARTAFGVDLARSVRAWVERRGRSCRWIDLTVHAPRAQHDALLDELDARLRDATADVRAARRIWLRVSLLLPEGTRTCFYQGPLADRWREGMG